MHILRFNRLSMAYCHQSTDVPMELVEEEPAEKASNAQGKSKALVPEEEDSVTEPDDSEEEDAKPTALKDDKIKAAQMSPTKRAAFANSDSDAASPSPVKKSKMTTKKTIAASDSEEGNKSPKKKAPPVRQPVRRPGKKW